MVSKKIILSLLISNLIKAEFVDTFEYDKKYKNISQKTNQPLAVVVVAFNRPDYLTQTIAALEKNPESQTVPFYFFLDGGTSSKQVENIAVINNSSLAHTEIIIRPYNYGCPKNHIDSKRFIFDWCNYKKALILEDDVEVSPTYIKFIQAFHKWARANRPKCGIVQCWSFCFLSPEKKRQQLNHVNDNGVKAWWSFVSYCLEKDMWDKMKDVLYYYETQFIDKIPLSEPAARNKPGKWSGINQIREWIAQLIANKKTPMINSRLLGTFSNPKFACNQDNMMAVALWMAGYTKFKTVVNRVRHIGENGISYTPYQFTHAKHDKIKLDNFDEDKTLETFILKAI